ncbi:hypothetical protein M441DRAFT_79954 [Trichoderma asperellum CBS 433.97]|uniref:Uncharacterized protein n=1 Tax=Trichoderma asperellum (strain ATCC 204424 / CBS 433.97 / NBRC 101777) TaxID=1042311 RepID=A0A2T3ZAQ9_TRIA4|nr:hypothetical protein M441DRAFT_79954 [Trichoderma asperellum CBS 433.97]PTB41898.1 hypothetical protein M441DRAFT_79954 [Trichoderma asperellum CBS 433.97]
MKFLTLLTIAAATCATAQNSRRSIPRRRRGRQIGGPSPGIVPISQVPAVEVRATETGHNNRKGNNKGCNGEAGNQPANIVNASSFTGQTLVLFEVGGVPGNECLTFRNNGEIVNAACVNEAADRQLTPSILNGADVMIVQRSFSSGFRPDLVDKQVCVGFNGTDFKAEDCQSKDVELVRFTGTNMVASGGACLNGHDNFAQITVDANGQGCAVLNPTVVTPTPKRH